MDESVRNKLRQADASIRISDISNRDGSLTFLVNDASKVDAVREAILPLTSGAGLTGQRDWNIEVVDGNRFVLTPTQEGIDQAVSQAMDTAVEVVRKRIDGLGTKEPTILRQGATRIVVQVPGLQDPQALKALLGQTAKLEFKMVDDTALPSDLARGVAPVGSQVLPYAEAAAGARSRSSVWAAFAATS
jgi:preprotein translocase subunit SecD